MKIFENIDNYILQNPEFEKASKIHDWRNYVPDEFEKEWNNLTLREKQIIFVLADKQASEEEWD